MPHSSSAAISRSAEPLNLAFNHDDIVLQLGQYYGQVKRQILRYQSATSGLFPRLSNDQQEAHIRDSIYCAVAVWSLYVAYTKRIDDDRGKAHDLGQSVVKCMRGILFAWMRQSEEKMEFFKANQSPKHALHSKFSLHTALSSDADYPHLQIDVVSLYLLFLAQMINSGLQIIYCLDEVTFVQNLVYYVERAYRTPDYGNWEQDNNNNTHNSSHSNINNKDKSLEIHSTSIGMAKAALEAINGCNLFGDKGANWSIIYVDVDAHSRNRSIFETLLPRESRSKNTDSYLLATISWPCFATHDPLIYASTKKKILKKLSGKYGLRRFLRDAYGTVIDSEQQQHNNQHHHQQKSTPSRQRKSSVLSRPFPNQSSSSTSCLYNCAPDSNCNHHHQHQHFYQHQANCVSHQSSPSGSTSLLNFSFSSQNGDDISYGTTSPTMIQVDDATKTSKKFEHIESEWPLFVCFLIIDGIFKNQLDQVHENEKLLFESLLKVDTKHKDYLMPKYYYVPTDLIQSERQEPDSVERRPSYEGSSSDCIYLMGQSLLLIARLLLNGLVQPSELDPIKRYMPSHDRPKKLGRYSSFQANSSDLVVQTVLITESIRLQAMMATYGIQTQTPLEVEPVQVWSSSQLVEVYELLGVNKKLGLRGRPDRPIGSLGTSKLYRICGQTILCYPLIFEVSDFYLSQDMALLIDDIQNELNFVGRYWRMSGRPTVCILIREEHLKDIHFRDLLDLLVEFKQGQLKKSGLKIKTGRLQNLISSSCIEHLDFLHLLSKTDLPQFKSFRQLDETQNHSLLNYQTLLATNNNDNSVGTSMTNLAQDYLEPLPNVNYFELYRNSPTWPTIIDALKTCETLYGQSQLLGLLWHREGAKYKIDDLSVEDRLERLSRVAGQLRYWSVVRYCSSVLKRSVESISPWITSILVNGKHLSVGYSKNEKIIDNPLTPSEIHSLIYSTVSASNSCDAVLQQEIALYIGRLISTKPELFDGIMTIRVGNFMSAMRSYLTIKTNHLYMHKQLQYNTLLNSAASNTSPTALDMARHNQVGVIDPLASPLINFSSSNNNNNINKNNNSMSSYNDQRPIHSSASNYSLNSMGDDQPTDLSIQSGRLPTPPPVPVALARPLESLSPSDVRKLVIKVLTDDESLPISDRRQITGEICRVPRDFYDKVWCLLGCTSVGIVIGGRILRSLPTLTHMSQHDLNFALKVESLLSRIESPKLRQINVELLMALHVVSERNPEIRFDHEPLDLDKIIELSLEKFRQDHNRKDYGLTEFYCMTTTTTMLYSVRTIFDILLPSHRYQECKIT